ncbi:hypothetical protein [Pseudonocardia acaciae]|nr:hypothetical protein [Pseudonocardia acaciae]
MRRLMAVVRDIGYGIHAGNAIRHGLPIPAPARPRRGGGPVRLTVVRR